MTGHPTSITVGKPVWAAHNSIFIAAEEQSAMLTMAEGTADFRLDG